MTLEPSEDIVRPPSLQLTTNHNLRKIVTTFFLPGLGHFGCDSYAVKCRCFQKNKSWVEDRDGLGASLSDPWSNALPQNDAVQQKLFDPVDPVSSLGVFPGR